MEIQTPLKWVSVCRTNSAAGRKKITHSQANTLLFCNSSWLVWTIQSQFLNSCRNVIHQETWLLWFTLMHCHLMMQGNLQVDPRLYINCKFQIGKIRKRLVNSQCFVAWCPCSLTYWLDEGKSKSYEVPGKISWMWLFTKPGVIQPSVGCCVGYPAPEHVKNKYLWPSSSSRPSTWEKRKLQERLTSQRFLWNNSHL